MGNKPISSFEESTWQPLRSEGIRTVIQNQETKVEVEKYMSILENTEFPSPESIYQWRAELPSEDCIVEMYEYGVKNGGVCDSFDEYFVIT